MSRKIALNLSENFRLCKIARRFNDLTKLRETIKENPEYAEFLEEFKEMPIAQLAELGVNRGIAESFFYLKGYLEMEFIEQFRETGRKFIE